MLMTTKFRADMKRIIEKMGVPQHSHNQMQTY